MSYEVTEKEVSEIDGEKTADVSFAAPSPKPPG
jgi:hypothetical protein